MKLIIILPFSVIFTGEANKEHICCDTNCPLWHKTTVSASANDHQMTGVWQGPTNAWVLGRARSIRENSEFSLICFSLKEQSSVWFHYSIVRSSSLMVRWVVGSILRGVDPLSYFSFQPVLHDWCNKGRGMCYPVCGMVHMKEPLLLIEKSSPCGGSGFPLSLSEWSFVWRHITVNKMCSVCH